MNYQSTKKGAEIDSGVRPYKVYTALLTQTGVNAPVATVLENTIGDIIWTRTSVGTFTGTLAGAFISGKTIGISTYQKANAWPSFILILGYSTNDTVLLIGTHDGVINDYNGIAGVEIRVYP